MKIFLTESNDVRNVYYIIDDTIIVFNKLWLLMSWIGLLNDGICCIGAVSGNDIY